jgi:hypothetical protein
MVMNVVILDSKHWADVEANSVEREEIRQAVEAAANEVVKLIPTLPRYVNLVVNPTMASEVIPETGDMGMTYSDEYASVYFDCKIPYGKEKLLKGLRTTTFHELVHATTFQHDPWQPGVLFGVVSEGLATVFERDYGGAKPLWGNYEDDATMDKWLGELKELPDTGEKNHSYFVNHPDGRKWIIYKTGAWVIDKLLESGEDLFQLMELRHDDVIAKFEALKE